MDVLSVTGKKWIYKNSDTDKIKKIKETFNLDEISAKLISQRNIKLNELNNFINYEKILFILNTTFIYSM